MSKSWKPTTLVLSPMPIPKKEFSMHLEELTHILYDELCQLQKSTPSPSLTNGASKKSEANNEK